MSYHNGTFVEFHKSLNHEVYEYQFCLSGVSKFIENYALPLLPTYKPLQMAQPCDFRKNGVPYFYQKLPYIIYILLKYALP